MEEAAADDQEVKARRKRRRKTMMMLDRRMHVLLFNREQKEIVRKKGSSASTCACLFGCNVCELLCWTIIFCTWTFSPGLSLYSIYFLFAGSILVLCSEFGFAVFFSLFPFFCSCLFL